MFSLRKFGLIVAAIALASLAGCGQYGPLYLPDRTLARTPAQGSSPERTPGAAPDDNKQDSEFNAQPPALDKSRQP